MWDTNLFWCVMGLLGGLVTSIIFYYIGLKRKSLTYEITTTTLISNNASQLENLIISYNNKPIDNLYISNIKIINNGNCIIEKNDFVPLAPLSVTTTGKFIADSKNGMTLFTKNEYNNVYPLFRYDEADVCTGVIIAFDYISKKESITCTVFHTGSIEFGGKLKEGKISADNNTGGTTIGVLISLTSLSLCILSFIYAISK